MLSTLPHDLDPLDREIIERAVDDALRAVKDKEAFSDLDSDEELEAELRRELIQIALSNGISDAETLRDVLLDALLER